MKTLFDIESYRTRFLGGARQYLFFVLFAFPSIPRNDGAPSFLDVLKASLSTFGLGADQDRIPYLVKSTSLPTYSINENIMPYPGLDFKTAGLPTYGDWTVSLNIDEKGEILWELYNWLNTCRNGLPDDYMRKQEIHLIDYQGSTFTKYELYGAWLKSMGSVGLDYSSNDIATIEATFAFQHMTISTESPETTSLIKQATSKLLGVLG